jgi:hypothetical protein
MPDPFGFFVCEWSTRVASLSCAKRACEEILPERPTQPEKNIRQAFFECRDEDATATQGGCAANRMQVGHFAELEKK